MVNFLKSVMMRNSKEPTKVRASSDSFKELALPETSSVFNFAKPSEGVMIKETEIVFIENKILKISCLPWSDRDATDATLI